MPDFRCHMLDERGDLLFPADLTVDTAEAAILHAFDILRTSNERSSSRTVCTRVDSVCHEPTISSPTATP